MLDHDMRVVAPKAELASIIVDIDREGMPAPVRVARCVRRRRAIKRTPWWEE